jgi:CRP-like cAMP-binding protein
MNGPSNLSEAERICLIGELFATAAERFWHGERLAGRPFVSKPADHGIPGNLLDLVSDPVEALMVQFIMQRVESTPRELRLALGISRASLTRKIAHLRESGILVVSGRTRTARYSLRGADSRN